MLRSRPCVIATCVQIRILGQLGPHCRYWAISTISTVGYGDVAANTSVEMVTYEHLLSVFYQLKIINDQLPFQRK